jgi:hypothetical protein
MLFGDRKMRWIKLHRVALLASQSRLGPSAHGVLPLSQPASNPLFEVQARFPFW